MEFVAFASFVALVIAWIALPVRTPAVAIEEKKAAA
jgi:hypothetical protein